MPTFPDAGSTVPRLIASSRDVLDLFELLPGCRYNRNPSLTLLLITWVSGPFLWPGNKLCLHHGLVYATYHLQLLMFSVNYFSLPE